MDSTGRDFGGRNRLVAALDAAVGLGDERAVAAALSEALARLFGDRGFELPGSVFEPIADRYARRELYVSPTLGYSVVAMTWGPGQRTPIHDHDGAWCVEGVWRGSLSITRYEPCGRDGPRWRFAEAGTVHAGPGSTGSLIPPSEYHAILNSGDDGIAVSLHVYQRPLRHCRVFVPDEGAEAGWMRSEERSLAVDGSD
jgi:predicted metal-dependent enzyme (double-stranded beta helix superfamily)